jgi:hypothetical protein
MKKILCIHGIGGKDATINEWSPNWEKQILSSAGLKKEEVSFKFLEFDKVFTKYQKKNGIKYLPTILKLMREWAMVSIFKQRGVFGSDGAIRWYAGMVVQFADDEKLRQELGELLKAELDNNKPDLIYCHSLGTLLTYDFLRQEAVKGIYRDITLVTSGSQIAHPALLKLFGGKILPLNVRHWFNFHNPYDYVFAYEAIQIAAANFTAIETEFKENNPFNNHEVLTYMAHQNALLQGWPKIVSSINARSVIRNLSRINKNLELLLPSKSTKSKTKLSKKRKALLVGINDYPDPENQLNGCVNDVFRMSEVLQEMGFDPSEIKVVLNERATSTNLREMMDWLLLDAEDGDTRFFYYSGHGAQIPSSNLDGDDADHLDECLVTYDFDWKRENAYTDKEFLSSYSKLPYGVDFVTILDCCHSGGMTRDAGFKARGLNPPDDIRHRTIKWDAKRKMWIPRDLKLAKEKLFTKATKNTELYTGELGGTQRFGRGVSIWSDVSEYESTKKKYGTHGPYMPLIIEACKEKEYSYEYVHGVTSYGAFTYSLTTILRDLNSKQKKTKISFVKLVDLVSVQLKELGYQQTPQIIGPKFKVNGEIPFLEV